MAKLKAQPLPVAKVIPEYTIQPNAISQAMYNLGPYARKLIAMAMSMITIKDDDNYKVSFRASDFIEALGLERGGNTKVLIKAAVKECLRSHIDIDHDNGDWEGYTWFTHSRLEASKLEKANGWERIVMTFNPELGEVLKTLKGFTQVNLLDMGKLQSRYAIRFYELALSYSGFAGKNGNPPGTWYIRDTTLEELRELFKIEPKKYRDTKNFRVRVIDRPIKELNAARIGLHIEPEYDRRGKWLIGVRFKCRWVGRDEPLPVTPATETEREEEQLRAAFPEEFETYKAEYIAQKQAQPGLFAERQDSIELVAEVDAYEKLRAAHPDFFKTNKTTKSPKTKKRPSKPSK